MQITQTVSEDLRRQFTVTITAAGGAWFGCVLLVGAVFPSAVAIDLAPGTPRRSATVW